MGWMICGTGEKREVHSSIFYREKISNNRLQPTGLDLKLNYRSADMWIFKCLVSSS